MVFLPYVAICARRLRKLGDGNPFAQLPVNFVYFLSPLAVRRCHVNSRHVQTNQEALCILEDFFFMVG